MIYLYKFIMDNSENSSGSRVYEIIARDTEEAEKELKKLSGYDDVFFDVFARPATQEEKGLYFSRSIESNNEVEEND